MKDTKDWSTPYKACCMPFQNPIPFTIHDPPTRSYLRNTLSPYTSTSLLLTAQSIKSPKPKVPQKPLRAPPKQDPTKHHCHTNPERTYQAIMPWLGKEPEKRPKLSASNLARQGGQRYSPLDHWNRTTHTHEQLAVTGRTARSDRARDREREMQRRRAEERSRR